MFARLVARPGGFSDRVIVAIVTLAFSLTCHLTAQVIQPLLGEAKVCPTRKWWWWCNETITTRYDEHNGHSYFLVPLALLCLVVFALFCLFVEKRQHHFDCDARTLPGGARPT
jgi:hypothetical protein